MGNMLAGLSTGSAALSYYQRGIETAGHNIANAGLEGYSRQRVNVNANAPTPDGGVTVGGGVSVDSITRIRSAFLDAMYRTQLPTLGYWETRVDNLTNLETYVGQYDHNTFQTALDKFWSDMESVSVYPNETTTRKSLLGSTDTMISSLTGMRTQYDLYRFDLNEEVRDMVNEANGLIDDIAVLCKEIALLQGGGENPNDLLDERDRLAERLCKLTGATVGSPAIDEADGDYKIDLNGKLLIQGGAQYNCDGSAIKNTRHLVLVPMVGNNNYFDVQVENNIYDHISDLSVASVVIERNATDPASCSRNGVHDLYVERLANGKTWTVGGALGEIAGGERLDTIYSQDKALGIDGSFSLQVGTAGVKVTSRTYNDTIHNGVILTGPLGTEPTEHEFRIAGGEFEAYVNLTYDKGAGVWEITTDGGNTPLLTTTGGSVTSKDMYEALAKFPQLYATYDDGAKTFSIEGANTDDMRGHLLSITDIKGTLAQDMEIANKNPAAEITVTTTDTLRTIANKINAVYQSELVLGDTPAYPTNPPGVAPGRPEEWLHANVIQEPNGSYYIALTSDVSGEANRINVLPGSVCGANGDFSVAKLLGFTDTRTNGTSYMQLSANEAAASTIDKSAAYVDDAYFIYDGRHYLSESNSFADARIFKTTDGYGNVLRWDNPEADELARFAQGIRLNLNGLNHYYTDEGALSGNPATVITVRPHITNGEIFAMLESRDDMILGLEDYFDQIAWELITEVNATHYSGHGQGENLETTGTAYFLHVNGRYGASKNLHLNADLTNNNSLIAAGSGDGKGFSKGCEDGSTAIRMSQLKQTKLFDASTADFNTYFLKFVSDLGTQGYTANYMLEAQKGVADQIQAQRDSVMGVSTDEEMLDIIKFQQGVGAISRYMTALDDMLDRVINGMGRAGL